MEVSGLNIVRHVGCRLTKAFDDPVPENYCGCPTVALGADIHFIDEFYNRKYIHLNN